MGMCISRQFDSIVIRRHDYQGKRQYYTEVAISEMDEEFETLCPNAFTAVFGGSEAEGGETFASRQHLTS